MVKHVGKNYEMDMVMPKWTGKCPNGQGNAKMDKAMPLSLLVHLPQFPKILI